MTTAGRRRVIGLLLLALSVGGAPAGAIPGPDGCIDDLGFTVAVDGRECTVPLDAGRVTWEMKVYEGFDAEASFRILLADGTLAARLRCVGRDELLGDTTSFDCHDGFFQPPYHLRTGAAFWRDGLEMWGIVDLPPGGGVLIVSGHGTGPMTAGTT